MSFLDTLRQWDNAVTCVDQGDQSKALQIFNSIQEPNSKIYFNIGCLHLVNQDQESAEKAFDCSIGKDEHLAVAFFQRGITFYKKERFEESLGDFKRAFKTLRGNQLIDYKALGLRYKLYACEVLHNMALSEAQLGNWEKAQENLVKALDFKTESKLNLIDRALQCVLKQKLFKLVDFPPNVLFKPNKHYVAELEKKDYLGKAKVVASVVPQDDFSGFAPLQPQVEENPVGPKEPEVLRALEGEPHIVLFEFVPETSDELAVVPGNVVFVLQRGADNWASVVFNERRGLVPYNYLERLSLASKQNKGNPAPPKRDPPTRPNRRTGVFHTEKNNRDSQTQDSPEDDSFIIKVRSTVTFAISVPAESSFAALIEKISKKLSLPQSALTLSLTSEETEESVIDADTDMERVWGRAKGRRITLWCHSRELADENPETEVQFVALHSYESTNPEDLNFHEGDKITFLSRVNQDWLEGQCNGNTGIFPAAFVEEVPLSVK